MNLDLRFLLDDISAQKDLDLSLDLSSYEFDGQHPFKDDVKLKGELISKAGVLFIEANILADITLICDRYLEEFSYKFDKDISHAISRGKSFESDETIYIEKDKLDLNEIVYSDILLNLPTKKICREECNGICPMCGCNLNENDCSC